MMKRRKGYRLITVKRQQWQWGMGRQFITAICEDGSHLRTTLSKLLGVPWNIIEDEQDNLSLHVTPKDIAGWILSQSPAS
jgi:hypothetical protein